MATEAEAKRLKVAPTSSYAPPMINLLTKVLSRELVQSVTRSFTSLVTHYTLSRNFSSPASTAKLLQSNS